MARTLPRLLSRRRLITVREDALRVAQRIKERLAPGRQAELREVLREQHPADLAEAMQFLKPEEETVLFNALGTAEAAELLDEVDARTEANLVRGTSPDRLADILEELPSDDGADVVGGLTSAQAEAVLSLTDRETADDIRTLLAFPPDTAGGIMSTGYVDVLESATQAQALQRFREKTDAEHIFYVYVVDERGSLRGVVDLRRLLMADPGTRLRDLMAEEVVCVQPDCDQELVASLFQRYDLTALPVVEAGQEGRLLGVITADDVIDVIQEEADEDVAQLAGSDAQELDSKSPTEVARLRLPWLMATLFIELLGGLVIHRFDATLTRFILLASFMPVISAISGNTGLQSAAIIIRGLSTGHVQLSHWRHAVARQVVTTLILGLACSSVLGVIGAVWDGHWTFGVVVFLGMFLSINLAGVVGTVVPMISKRAGYDPALTAGPFETAFQDVVGITIFLSLAATLLQWLR
jgi:magnesium transporter